jgi:hypothetical protein
MPYSCTNVVRVEHEDSAVLGRIEDICKHIIWVGEQPPGAHVEPPTSLEPPSRLPDRKDNDDEECDDIYLGHFEEVSEILAFARDRNGIECRFYSRGPTPEMLYRELEDFGCVISATTLDTEYGFCGLYENGTWQHFDLVGPHQAQDIPERIREDYGLPSDRSEWPEWG